MVKQLIHNNILISDLRAWSPHESIGRATCDSVCDAWQKKDNLYNLMRAAFALIKLFLSVVKVKWLQNSPSKAYNNKNFV